MRKTRRNLAVTIIFLSVAHSALAQGFVCNHNGNQQEMNQCAQDDFVKADSVLNRLYKTKMAASKSPLHQKRLQAAQQAWIRYRDASCLYEAGEVEESGSIWPLDYYGCMTTLTLQRNVILQNYVNCTHEGCIN